jgi:hypothetical protein
LDDADEFIAVFPDLPLSKTERHASFLYLVNRRL